MENKEEIVGYVKNCTKGTWGTTSFIVLFTTNRVIIAKNLGLGAQLGYIALGGALIATGVSDHRQNKIAALSPEIILSKDKTNYAIPYSEITQIKIKKSGTLKSGHIKIESTKGEQKFTIANKGALGDYNFNFVTNLPSSVRNKIIAENFLPEAEKKKTLSTDSDKTRIEIYCPECKQLFHSEREMIEHYDKVH